MISLCISDVRDGKIFLWTTFIASHSCKKMTRKENAQALWKNMSIFPKERERENAKNEKYEKEEEEEVNEMSM